MEEGRRNRPVHKRDTRRVRRCRRQGLPEKVTFEWRGELNGAFTRLTGGDAVRFARDERENDEKVYGECAAKGDWLHYRAGDLPF